MIDNGVVSFKLLVPCLSTSTGAIPNLKLFVGDGFRRIDNIRPSIIFTSINFNDIIN